MSESHPERLKRVLIITYYWPPSGGIGVLRCLKFAKYLQRFGWEPIVFTARNAHYPSRDYSNDRDIPQGMEVLTCPILEPYSVYKMLTLQAPDTNVNNVFNVIPTRLNRMHQFAVWVRSNFFIPDARALWIGPAFRFLSRWLERNRVDAIISNGPPHSNTRIATLVKKKFGIPWLADFQDPWTQVDYYQLLKLMPWADARHRRMEQEAFRHADRMSVVSKVWARSLAAIGAKNVEVLYWGFDPADYAHLDRTLDSRFTLTYFGIMGYDRNPVNLFKAIAVMVRDFPGFRDDFRLQLIGQVDHSVWEVIDQEGIRAVVDDLGSMSRQDTLQRAQGSHALLLLLNCQPNAEGRIPGKSFEYMALQRPILFLGDTQSEIAGILSTASGNFLRSYEDHEGILADLQSLYGNYLSGPDNHTTTPYSETYSVIKQTEKLARILDGITA